MSHRKSAIDIKLIRELAELLNETDLHEIEVEEDELRIRLSRGGEMMVAPQHYAMPAPAPALSHAPQQGGGNGNPAASEEKPASGDAVTSPMVGTAYLSPAPGAEPFVQIGQQVKKGETIMIVEAMKTMNQIPAPREGTVQAIDVEDGQPVEFGQTLITLA